MNKSKQYNENNENSIYIKSLLTSNVDINIKSIGKNIKLTLEKILKKKEGYCISEGYIKPNSINIMDYSSGFINDGCNIRFNISYSCDICLPVIGMRIKAQAVNITRAAGIKAKVYGDEYDPLIIFLARDNHYDMEYFNNVKENDIIYVKVIGQRYELNDKHIHVIAELEDPAKQVYVRFPEKNTQVVDNLDLVTADSNVLQNKQSNVADDFDSVAVASTISDVPQNTILQSATSQPSINLPPESPSSPQIDLSVNKPLSAIQEDPLSQQETTLPPEPTKKKIKKKLRIVSKPTAKDGESVSDDKKTTKKSTLAAADDDL